MKYLNYIPTIDAEEPPMRSAFIERMSASHMPSGLGIILRVIVAPNSAFAEIRDNAARYFPWSLGIVVFVGILSTIMEDPWALLFDVFEYTSGIAAGIAAVIAAVIAVNIATFFAFTAVIYLIGRLLGGNRNWKQVFSVISYAEIIWIPIIVTYMWVGEISLIAFWSRMAWTVVMIPLIVWGAVVAVKAIKVVNGFGTAKAFGLVVLAVVIILVVYVSLMALLHYLLVSN